MTRGRRRGWITTHPLSGTCNLCDRPLGTAPLFKHRGRWFHRACWTAEKGE